MNAPEILLLAQVARGNPHKGYAGDPPKVWPEYKSELPGREKPPSMFSLSPERGV